MCHSITIRGALAHNLRGLDLEIPHHRLVVITGVSGSGKSSLAFDTVCREGQRRYLESFSARARQLLGKLGQADADRLDHLSPAIALNQRTTVRNPRSTVGTLSELDQHLRLLLARCGQTPDGRPRSRAQLSFNSAGACPRCRGLGVEDAIDPAKLIADPARTLRQGALVITTDSGYIIYSQVTMDALNQVCQAHGFDVDIPWRDLTDEQREVVLYGSDRVEIPFGKHTLESRMKWSGITARPRPTGHYGGIVPVMEGILKRDRNRNILRFVRTRPCPACHGTRLNPEALAVTYAGNDLAAYDAMTIDELGRFLDGIDHQAPAATAIVRSLVQRIGILCDLGLGYLTLDRDGPSLSGGEAQRLRLAALVGSGLRGLTYVFDEPSMGLHPRDQQRLLAVLRRLVDQGNTVIAVEHDHQTMLAADWLIDLGPGAGQDGGELLFAGPPTALLTDTSITTPTALALRGDLPRPDRSPRPDTAPFVVHEAHRHNLQHLDVAIPRRALTAVSGVSGAGKSTLLAELADAAPAAFDKVVTIDQAPIGRTPRSNAATYTGLFDHLRALFAAEPLSRELGLGKGQFSFNNKGGRCDRCEGAGVKRLGMHFLSDVELVCEACGGRRFGPEILRVEHRGLNVSQVLDLPIAQAARIFADEPRLARHLDVLVELGLGYLSLGQPSTTLSGGEAQRIKLAAELGRTTADQTLYLLDEPTTGLHAADVAVLLRALDRLVAQGGTVVVTEHHHDLLRFADHVIDLGPESGAGGGRVVFAGPADQLPTCQASITGRWLARALDPTTTDGQPIDPTVLQRPIELRGVATHNLRDVDVDIPVGAITVVTGVSGSGKSSLALDTLHAEGRSRYAESFSTYVRQQLGGHRRPDLGSSWGLMPSVAIGQSAAGTSRRSTVATAAEIHPLLRLMFSRLGGQERPAGFFSFNHADGACPACRGLGQVTVCDPERLVTDPERSLLDGALDGHKTGRFYGERDGQYVATLRQVGRELGHDFERPWHQLDDDARRVAMHGAGERRFSVSWEFKRGKSQGTHRFDGPWPGFCALVDDEYRRKHADRRGDGMLPVMSDRICEACLGRRHGPEVLAITVDGRSIADACAMTVDEAATWFAAGTGAPATVPQLADEVARRLATMQRVGLGYLTLDRATATLSSGEFRRLRLVRQLGVRLQGVTVVLDEPTLGLHPDDVGRLWPVLEELRDQGNTVVLVEHDPEVIRAADHVIDVGPGAGAAGGRIVAAGPPAEVMATEASLTGQWLRRDLATTGPPRPTEPSEVIGIHAAHLHNLQRIDVDLAVGELTAVVGPSGSGKTSLVFGVLAASAAAGRPVGCEDVHGLDRFDTVIPVRPGLGQSAGAGSPATAAGLAPLLRKLLAGTEQARQAGLAARHFGTAGKGGRCEVCKGTGRHDVALDFMADVTTPCPACGGTGFTDAVLACRWRDLSIADMLALSVDQALDTFKGQRKLTARLQVLADAGLGYLPLGQPTRTLSGGERQRLHLACHLLPGSKGRHLYLCDEPTAGLHMADVDRLAALLRRLVDAGHTVVVTEHNRQLIAAADRVVALGPGAGAAGGRLVS